MASEEKTVVETKDIAAPVAAPEPSALGPEPTKTEIPATEPVKAVETPKVEEKAAQPVKAEEKPVEAPKAVETKPVEVKAEEKKDEPAKTEVPKPVEPPKFEFKLPEGLKLEEPKIKDISSMLGSFESASKADHAEVQKFGQAIVEYGLGIVKESVDQLKKQADEYWDTKTKEYREAFEKDPEIGGPRMEATAKAARDFIAQHAGSEKQAQELRQVLKDHKLDNHPSIIRLLANANLARSEGKPLPGQKPVPIKQGKLDRWYGQMKE